MAFKLPPLPYAFDALEPHIDARTMEIHHDKHHQAYVTNLNKAVATDPQLAKKPVEELVRDLGAAMDKKFGNFAGFKDEFAKAATGQFGSGWAWLTLDGKDLKVEAAPNQDNPLSQGRSPLLGIDVWEHAYYLKYQNRRPEYISAFFNVINWDFVAERYAKGVA